MVLVNEELKEDGMMHEEGITISSLLRFSKDICQVNNKICILYLVYSV